MQHKVPVLFLLLPAVFVLLGGWLTVRSLKTFYFAYRASSWPECMGTVTKTGIVEKRGRKGAPTYKVETSFDYAPTGERFTSNIIHPTYGADGNYKAHDELRKRLVPGKPVRVLYNPDDPSQACLATGFVSGGLASLLGPLLFLGVGLGFACMMLAINYANYDYASLIRNY